MAATSASQMSSAVGASSRNARKTASAWTLETSRVPGAIVLLLGTGLLVLPDPAARVFRGIDGADEAELPMTVSDESVDEESGFVLFQEDIGVEKAVEILTGPFVDSPLRRDRPPGKVDLGPDDAADNCSGDPRERCGPPRSRSRRRVGRRRRPHGGDEVGWP